MMHTHMHSGNTIHTVRTISHFLFLLQPQAQTHTRIHTNTHAYVKDLSNKQAQENHKTHTHTNNIPLSYKQFPTYTLCLSQFFGQKKKKKKPKCSVADSERIEASSSPKLREFSWGYWISPSPLCSVVSLTYRGHSAGWIRSAVKRGPKVCRDSLGSGSLACYSLNAAPGSSGAQAGGHRLCHLSISRTEADLTCSEAFNQKGLTVIHTYIHTLMSVAAMQSADQHIRSSLGFSILLKDTSTPSDNKTLALPPEPQN